MTLGTSGWKSSQCYPFNASLPQTVVGPMFFLPNTDYLPDYVICNIALYCADVAW